MASNYFVCCNSHLVLCAATNVKLGNLLTGEPLSESDDIPTEGSPVYGAGPQPPTAATGGDGVAELENQACNLPPDLQVAPGTQPPTATTAGEDFSYLHLSFSYLVVF